MQLTGTSGGQDSLPKAFAPIPSQNIPETTNNDPQIAVEVETREQGNGAARDNLKSPLRARPSSSLDMESGYKVAGGYVRFLMVILRKSLGQDPDSKSVGEPATGEEKF